MPLRLQTSTDLSLQNNPFYPLHKMLHWLPYRKKSPSYPETTHSYADLPIAIIIANVVFCLSTLIHFQSSSPHARPQNFVLLCEPQVFIPSTIARREIVSTFIREVRCSKFFNLMSAFLTDAFSAFTQSP